MRRWKFLFFFSILIAFFSFFALLVNVYSGLTTLDKLSSLQERGRLCPAYIEKKEIVVLSSGSGAGRRSTRYRLFFTTTRTGLSSFEDVKKADYLQLAVGDRITILTDGREHLILERDLGFPVGSTIGFAASLLLALTGLRWSYRKTALRMAAEEGEIF